MARNRRPKFVIGWIPLLISFVRVSALSLVVFGAMAQLYGQTKVLTYHNDDARTGQNLTETILTPANVDSNHFGKLHSVTVDGYVHAQPLVATNIDIPGQGTHNVVYVATENDSLYAIDADDGSVLWHVSFIDPSAGVTTLSSSVCSASPPQIGISGTPVIDASTGTIYLVALTQENGTYIQRLHAIDLATHAEKFGGPVVIQASASGIGSGSVNGTINFDPRYSNQRGGLLLRNGHVIIAWAAFCDASLWHGWVMSYDAGTLSQEAVLNLSPSGTAAGVWMGGGGLAADADSNFYFATGNGDFDGISNFGNSILKITGPSNGSFALQDWFTPYDQATLNGKDSDLGAGGVLLLPDLPPGFAHSQVLVQAGKTGTIYVLDRNNMGKYCSTCTTSNTQILQEIVKANPGMRGLPAYWNGNLYIGGGHTDYMKAFSFNANNDGLLSTSPSSKTPELFSYPGPTPSVSANGKTSGILWALENGTYASSCCQVLRAYDATNLANELYNTSQAPNGRDVPGAAVKFTVPTVANGKVYVGSQASLSIYGLLPAAATPDFSPAAGTYSSPQSVTLSDNSAGTNIYFTTDGSAPTSSSTVYTSPLSVSTTTTIKAMAAAAALSPSAVGSATYTIQQAAATPVFSPAAGTYTSAQSVTLSDNSAGTTIYYTINGVTPTTSSPVYSAPIAVSTTTTIKAMAAGGAFTASAVGSATYTIQRAAATPVFSPV
ncbi:MAG: chitobiase/beta-hexosaminidase C-terminal domain-containing protein, partial [Bryobacteraceae bacterium]